jgi:hypothetical protein
MAGLAEHLEVGAGDGVRVRLPVAEVCDPIAPTDRLPGISRMLRTYKT